MVGKYLSEFVSRCSCTHLEECWKWNGSTRGAGYGQCSEFVHKSRIAARAVYELCNGLIQDAWVLHTCDNVLCVNPSHLFLGTPKDNTQDMLRKGRFGAHAKDRKYSTVAARIELSKLYASNKFRSQQGRRIVTGQIMANERNVRHFAFGASV